MRNQNFESDKPLVYLIATPIGNLKELTPRALEILKSVDLIACEDTRVTGKLLEHFSFEKPLVSLREHNEVSVAHSLVLDILKLNRKVAYVSDAGYPCISDPGAKFVKILLENEINVSVVSGPNAALNALAGSGLNTDRFYFHGFLNAREKIRLEELRKLAKREETLIFYESPHRIQKTLQDMFNILGRRSAVIARELTKKHEEYIRSNLEEMQLLDPKTLKGEMVIIIEGSLGELQPDLNNEEICKMVKNLTNIGMSTKDAIKRVSELTSINKNFIYKIYHLN